MPFSLRRIPPWATTTGLAILAGIIVEGLKRAFPEKSDRPFGELLIRAANEDLRAALKEEGANDGPEIRQYLAAVGINEPANWCAAAVTAWIRAAAETSGVSPPIAGSASAKALADQIAGATGGRWYSADELRQDPTLLRPGMVVVWDRSQPGRPETSWWGHVGVVVAPPKGPNFQTIEGNSGPKGDRVAENDRSLMDAKLIGAGNAWALPPRNSVIAVAGSPLRARRRALPSKDEGGG